MSVDIGGTFTDCVVEDDDGVRLFKSPTTPDDPPRGVLDVLRRAAGDEPLESFLRRVERFVHGTTLATNVLLTGRGARTGMLTTAGFRDVIEIRRGIKNLGSSMFDQFMPPYEPLVPRSRRIGVPERSLYTGEIEQPLDEDATEEAVDRLVADGCEAIAIGFLHSYAVPGNELMAAEVIRRRHAPTPTSTAPTRSCRRSASSSASRRQPSAPTSGRRSRPTSRTWSGACGRRASRAPC